MSFKVEGGDEMKKVAKALKQAGDKELSREFSRGMSRAVKPLMQMVKVSAPLFLPDRYAAELSASLRGRTKRRMGKNPRLELVGSARTKQGKKRDLASLNRGRLRHPLYGDRGHWFDQKVRKDWWTHPLISGAPIARREVERSMGEVAKKISRKAS